MEWMTPFRMGTHAMHPSLALPYIDMVAPSGRNDPDKGGKGQEWNRTTFTNRNRCHM
ncbi:hypothetical protein AA12717_1662 [Gluconacetobacter sacchari DSM 12717]|uniref:Uncharacterized protein n=1 Tax=Gluconacetobacter sacchari DSM 12717 TaxID=1307940 RepID=A0ABQ0P6A6_9PROT|nr:hypothetical protein AA12717_1662 [Gluconacetobacter sacchari DSM 12717]